MVEKIGTSKKYIYHTGEKLKLHTVTDGKSARGVLLDIQDSMISLYSGTENTIKLKDVTCVYKQFKFPKKFGIKAIEFGGVIFIVMVANNLLNHAPPFDQYVFVVSGSFVAGGLISLSLSEKRCNIGHRWKIKVLDKEIY
jgi:hypothetical protein